MVFPVVRQALVECSVLFRFDIRGVSRPDRFRLVQLFVFRLLLLYLFHLLVLGFLILVLDLLDLRPVALLLGIGFLLSLFILDFLKTT
jgi:hypothetical protein